ncbi:MULTISPECIES: YpiF family protein [Metabacillus]|uniref:YpiF family protein n=1 Tax=Metabacillus rhizolycopersici TaxID=2875709 RepID=A0ABS7UTX9_9BACI|nr:MULTISPECIES: YpiF family protein [Metabacillus]MBZ5751484.1 YpiF family protein [Metabacillus rhizolycopersici]MCM3652106.1 YpiF family protein [Metabacillus litoralis]
MKWVLSDVDVYNQSREYVDTAIVPLIPVSLEADLKGTVSKGEFITYVSVELERQLKGRVFLFPSLSYLKKSKNVIESVIEWKTELQEEFKHVIFLTSDETLKEYTSDQQNVKDDLIWLPSVPFEHMDESLMKKLLEDQIQQILNILLQSWNK